MDKKIEVKESSEDHSNKKSYKEEDVDMDEKDDVTIVEDGKPTKKKKEPDMFRISNPSRITKHQAEFCTFDLNQRYKPIRLTGKIGGIIILTDSTPGKEEDVKAVKTPSLDAEDEAETPEPFEWAPPGHAEYVAPIMPTEKIGKTPSDTKK